MRLEFLLFDPGAEKQLALPAAEMPVNIGDVDGKFMTQTVDLFMATAFPYVRCICFDGHGSIKSSGGLCSAKVESVTMKCCFSDIL